MGKEFIEYHSENGDIPYPTSLVCLCLTNYAKDYIKENHKMTFYLDNKLRDYILVDVINYLGNEGSCDFGLCVKDLYENKNHDEYIEPQVLLTVIKYFFTDYMFNFGINSKDPIDISVIIDFINYIAQVNGYNRKFTLKDLREEYNLQNHNIEMKNLKEFLELSGKYEERLKKGESINSIFKKMSKEKDLKCIGKNGKYYYTNSIRKRLKQDEMHCWDIKRVDNEIYAIAYAYAKYSNNESKIPVINEKIKEMKKI